MYKKAFRCSRWSAIAVVALFTTPGAARGHDIGLFSTTVEMPDTDEFYRDDVTGYRSYVELAALQFVVMAANESAVPVVLDEAKFHEAFQARIGDAPALLEWLSVQKFDDDAPVATSGREKLPMKPGTFVKWVVAIRHLDSRPFTWGEYLVSLHMENLRQTVSTDDGRVWAGRLNAETGIFRRLVSVKAPTTAAETGRQWGIIASAAARLGNYETALQAMRRAAAVDSRLEDNLALLYLSAGRYKEAVDGYERIAARGALRGNDTRLLAQAYIGIGAEGKAFEVLLQGGVPRELVADEIANMRQRVSERAAESPR